MVERLFGWVAFLGVIPEQTRVTIAREGRDFLHRIIETNLFILLNESYRVSAGIAGETFKETIAGLDVGIDAKTVDENKLIYKLKQIKRSGWLVNDINDCESIADHMYGM